ncbi:hypothetical protein JCM24511_06128 [Saitozyma sp. JCM 24511]|nr:hypothetical protein JCM24511_06128 [Saitozyma sp. JCM 24511]
MAAWKYSEVLPIEKHDVPPDSPSHISAHWISPRNGPLLIRLIFWSQAIQAEILGDLDGRSEEHPVVSQKERTLVNSVQDNALEMLDGMADVPFVLPLTYFGSNEKRLRGVLPLIIGYTHRLALNRIKEVRSETEHGQVET